MARHAAALLASLLVTACATLPDEASEDTACEGKCDGASRPNRAGTKLTAEERDRILAKVGTGVVELGEVPHAMFVLHDTAGATSNSFMEKQVADARGPLGEGVALWVSPTKMFQARALYDEARPTTSLYERAKDVLQETEFTRLGRQLWAKASPDQRTRAVQDVLAPIEMSTVERQDEAANATRQLDGEGTRLFTTAGWTVEQLCTTALASDALCIKMAPYFTANRDRISRSVNVEIGQVAGANCLASGAPLPTYTDAVYANLTLAYLESALSAGELPETQTHFEIDKAFRGHCDPRCFDLDRLYRSIATELGHAPETQYGVTPKYGTTYGQHTVWWSEAICGAPAPR